MAAVHDAAAFELAKSLGEADIPAKLRCAACNQLALNAVKLPCCDQSICETCQSVQTEACPVCMHSPVDISTCKPNKSLRLTIKAFLKAEEKKRSKLVQSEPIVKTPEVIASEEKHTTQPIVADRETPNGNDVTDVVESIEEPGEAVMHAAQDDDGLVAINPGADMTTQSEAPDAQQDSDPDDKVAIGTEVEESVMDEDQRQEGLEDQNEPNDGFNSAPNQGMNQGMNPMMAMGMPNPGFGNFNGAMGMPAMNMGMPNMFGGFGGLNMGMGDMSSMNMNMMMGMGVGGNFGNWNGHQQNMNGNYGFYSDNAYNQQGQFGNQMRQFPNQNYSNHVHGRGAYRGYGRGRGGFRGRGNFNRYQNQNWGNQQGWTTNEGYNGGYDDGNYNQEGQQTTDYAGTNQTQAHGDFDNSSLAQDLQQDVSKAREEDVHHVASDQDRNREPGSEWKGDAAGGYEADGRGDIRMPEIQDTDMNGHATGNNYSRTENTLAHAQNDAQSVVSSGPPLNAPTGPKAMRTGHTALGQGRQSHVETQHSMSAAFPDMAPRSDAGESSAQQYHEDRSDEGKRSRRDRSYSPMSTEGESRQRRREKRSRREDRHDDDYGENDEHDRRKRSRRHSQDRRSRSRSPDRADGKRSHRGDKEKRRSSRSHRDSSRDVRRRSHRSSSRHRSDRRGEEDERDDDYDRHDRKRARRDRDRHESSKDYDHSNEKDSRRSSRYEKAEKRSSNRRRSRSPNADDLSKKIEASRRKRHSEAEQGRERPSKETMAPPASDEIGFKIKGSRSAVASRISSHADNQPPSGPKGDKGRARRESIQSTSAQGESVLTPVDPYALEREARQRERMLREEKRREAASTVLGRRSSRGQDGDRFDPPSGPRAGGDARRRSHGYSDEGKGRRNGRRYEEDGDDERTVRAEREREAGRWR